MFWKPDGKIINDKNTNSSLTICWKYYDPESIGMGKNGDFRGLSGRGGALEISRRVTRKLQDKNRMSTKQLFDKIMASA
jgi:hypothetical protein